MSLTLEDLSFRWEPFLCIVLCCSIKSEADGGKDSSGKRGGKENLYRKDSF